MYSILIKDKLNLYRFLTVKKEIMKEQTQEVTDPETQEVHNEAVYVGTGKYESSVYQTDSKDELEEKCLELMKIYNVNQFIPVKIEDYSTDLIWES